MMLNSYMVASCSDPFPSWAKYQPLLAKCTCADLTSAVLLGDSSNVQNVFTVLTFTQKLSRPSEIGRLEFLTDRPETIPRTSYRLAIARSTLTIADALSAIPADGRFVEPVKETPVACPGTWADPIFIGQEMHRLRSLVPHVDRQFWAVQHVPPANVLSALIGESGIAWTMGKVSEQLRLSFSTRQDCVGAFFIVLPEYRAAIRTDRGKGGRVGVEYRGDRGGIKPVAMIRSTRNDELCSCVVSELKTRYTVLEAATSDFEEVELYDLNSGMLLDREAGHLARGFEMDTHVAEPIKFDVELHDDTGQLSGNAIHVETNWGHVQKSGVDNHAGWEHTQRRAAILAEQKRLHADGRLFFYSGGADEREKAVKDIRGLVRMHSHNRLCIWDPYFSGRDAAEFLPHVADPCIPIRILTSLSSADGTLVRAQEVQLLEAIAALGLPRGRGPGMTNMMARLGHGFHDRFLITDVSCWQLGTSFNQIGRVYSTIVEFPYSDLVLQAFEREWELAKPLGGRQ